MKRDDTRILGCYTVSVANAAKYVLERNAFKTSVTVYQYTPHTLQKRCFFNCKTGKI